MTCESIPGFGHAHVAMKRTAMDVAIFQDAIREWCGRAGYIFGCRVIFASILILGFFN
jgi:hypothetical protein